MLAGGLRAGGAMLSWNSLGRKSLASRKVYLEVDGRRFGLPAGESTVGRSRSCTVMLTDRSVSRTHAMVAVYPDRVTLQDLNSSNGTFVNGHRLLGETELLDGDRVLLGKTELRLAWQEAEAGEPAVAAEAAAGESESPLTRSEALSAGEVLAVGEVLAADASGFWETTGPGLTASGPGAGAPRPGDGQDPGGGMAAEPAAEPEIPAVRSPHFPGDTAAAGASALIGPSASLPETAEPAAEPEIPAVPAPTVASTAPPAAAGGTEVLPSIDSLDGTFAAGPGEGEEEARPVEAAAGLWPRLAAALFDVLWMGLLGLTATFLAGGPQDPGGRAAGAATFLALGAAVSVFGWSVYGTTPGKRLLGLYVCRDGGWVGLSPGRALLRLLGYLASALTLGAGFLMVAFSPARRGLHDRLAGSHVVRRL